MTLVPCPDYWLNNTLQREHDYERIAGVDWDSLWYRRGNADCEQRSPFALGLVAVPHFQPFHGRVCSQDRCLRAHASQHMLRRHQLLRTLEGVAAAYSQPSAGRTR